MKRTYVRRSSEAIAATQQWVTFCDAINFCRKGWLVMEFIILWVVLACAAYSLAKSKGRNKNLWFLIALGIGPFASLILAFLPTTPEGDQDYL